MLFDYLKDIFVNKNGNLPLEEYIPFLINRWISFSSSNACLALNESVNQFGNLEKDIHYKLLLTAFPKQKYQPRINYIKKIKKEATEEDNKVDMLASNLELSTREVKQMLEFKEQLN